MLLPPITYFMSIGPHHYVTRATILDPTLGRWVAWQENVVLLADVVWC